MIYFIADKTGKYVRLRGSKEDLKCMYGILEEYAFINDYYSYSYLDKKNEKHTAFKSRSELNSHFLYEIRHCSKGHRRIVKNSRLELLYEFTSYECIFSWVYILFFFHSIRRNMCFKDVTKLEQSLMLHLEYRLEKAMREYDVNGANILSSYIYNRIDADNPYIYQFMRNIDKQLLLMPNGKKTFRQIPQLLKAAVNYTKEYMELLANLTIIAKEKNCNIEDLDWDE